MIATLIPNSARSLDAKAKESNVAGLAEQDRKEHAAQRFEEAPINGEIRPARFSRRDAEKRIGEFDLRRGLSTR